MEYKDIIITPEYVEYYGKINGEIIKIYKENKLNVHKIRNELKNIKYQETYSNIGGKNCINKELEDYMIPPIVYIYYSLFVRKNKIPTINDIFDCYIKTFCKKNENDTFLFKETFEVPKKSILLYAFKDGERLEIKEDEKVFDTKRLVPESFIPKDRRFYYLINPLYFEEDNFGFLCFELVNDDIIHFESLWAQISNILNGALILMEKDKIKK